jgi:hypothetical protein
MGSNGLSWQDMYGFTRSLLTEGVAYVMLATVMNAINLTFFELPVATTVQGMFATMGIAVTSLASQRILLHILDPANKSTYARSNLGIETTQGVVHSSDAETGAIRTIGGGLMPGRKARSGSHSTPSTRSGSALRSVDSVQKSLDPEQGLNDLELSEGVRVNVRVDVERDAGIRRSEIEDGDGDYKYPYDDDHHDGAGRRDVKSRNPFSR